MAAYGGFAVQLMLDYFAGKTVKAMLAHSTYVQAVQTEGFKSDLPAGFEVTGGGYPAGGVTVTGVIASYDTVTGHVVVDCDDINFGLVDSTDIAGVIFYIATGVDATSRLLGYDQYVTPIAVSGPLTHQIAADGFFSMLVGT